MGLLTFGANCVHHAIAQYIKNKNARKTECLEKIDNSILCKFHVDDYLDFADSKEEAMEKILEIIRVQRLDGFEVVNWVCNPSKIMGEPGEVLVDEKCFNDNSLSTERVLGVWWD
ncbi:hypothetical protein JTB14_002068 [Gonioctena quinquepunctata]|nr:hypothetical protein JTB14_002068 [Gonioctena quinquepunctata]